MPYQQKPLFTFAVIADTHMNQAEDTSSSPYPCNALANARTRQVVAELNQHKPEFVLHLGDIINPVPELPTYEDAANHFKSLMADLNAPLYLVPGNHDVGDKPVSWMPAGQVNEEYLALYERHFGPHYFSFDYEDLHVVIVNAQLFNSGLDAEEEHKQWLVNDLATNADKRIFIGIHYPPYVSNPDENGSYDNIDEPGRSWLMDLVARYAPEAMFCGHVHNFWYDRLHDTEMYLLPSTAFVRHDYSEFYRIGPGDQQGRNDEPKLGYFLVRIYEDGHVIENIRTYGRTLEPSVSLPEPAPAVQRSQTKESAITCVGLDMRQPWAEEMEITPSGAIDEFERKLARNDYPVLALWEMGVRRMRVPIQDLINPRIRRRIEVMKKVGHIFQVYCYGLPDTRMTEALREYADLVAELEIVISWDTIETSLPEIAALKGETGVKTVLSRVNRKDAAKHHGGKFNHLISHGFTLTEADELHSYFSNSRYSDAVDGIMFSIPRNISAAGAIQEAEAIADRLGKQACLYIKSTSSSPAEVFDDDQANACRTAEAVFTGSAALNVNIILDTFADTDRGYFSRSGLVDRRYNPKLGSHVVGNLFGILNEAEWRLNGVTSYEDNVTQAVALTTESGKQLMLLLPNETADGSVDVSEFIQAGDAQLIDLESGEIKKPEAKEVLVNKPLVLRV